MDKYICLCGVTHNDKESADLHVKMYEDLAFAEGYIKHKTFFMNRKARFFEWFVNFNWPKFMRFVGAYMIYIVFIHHFHIDWTWWEAMLIGIGMGLYIE